MAALTADPTNRVTLQKIRFEGQYKSALNEEDGKIFAPALEDWIQQPLGALADHFAPSEKIKLSDATQKKRIVPSWWGISSGRVVHGFERNALPSLLVNLGCPLRVIMAPCTKLTTMAEEKAIKSILEACAREEDGEVASKAGMAYARVCANGVMHIPAGYYTWMQANPDAGCQRGCFGWRANLNPIEGVEEVKDIQLKNLGAALGILQAEREKANAIMVKTPKLNRKIKQLQTDVAVIIEAQAR